jgi:hypothetical protein
MTQGALFSMAASACHDTAGTNVRFIEVYLCTRVEVDASAEKTGAAKASEFAAVYEEVLARDGIRGARVRVEGKEDLRALKWEKKVEVVV